MRRGVLLFLLVTVAPVFVLFFVPGAAGQSSSPCIPNVDCPTTTPTQPPPTTPPPCVGIGCIVTPRPTPSPTPVPTAVPSVAPTRTPTVSSSPTPSVTAAANTATPSPTPIPTQTPSPTPGPASPNRGLAVLGLFGSGGMLGSAAWIWRRYLS